MQTVTLYTKTDCHLCEDVKASLANCQPTYPHQLIEIDITQDHDTFIFYRFSIPVVKIGETTLHAPITKHQLAQALAANK